MGSLGLPATAMAVRSAFALLCFALLCGLAASSVVQSETETELKEGEAAGNQVLVEQALESRVVRGTKKERQRNACKDKPNLKRCRKTRKTKTISKNTKGKGKGKGIGKSKGKGKGNGKGNGRRNRKNDKKSKKSNPKTKKEKNTAKKLKKQERKLSRRLNKLSRKQNGK